MYLRAPSSVPLPVATGDTDPRHVVLAAAAIAALGWLTWNALRKKPRRRFCSKHAGPKLRKVKRIRKTGGTSCPR